MPCRDGHVWKFGVKRGAWKEGETILIPRSVGCNIHAVHARQGNGRSSIGTCILRRTVERTHFPVGSQRGSQEIAVLRGKANAAGSHDRFPILRSIGGLAK